MNIRLLASVSALYLRVCCKLVFIITKSTSKSIYCDCNGKIFNFSKYSLQETLS